MLTIVRAYVRSEASVESDREIELVGARAYDAADAAVGELEEIPEAGVEVDAYEPLTIRHNGTGAVKLTVMEFDGMLTVRDPDIFLARIGRGFGRGKAFGLGLMLLRRPAA